MAKCKKNLRLINFDINKIFKFLITKTKPISSVELLKYLFQVSALSECGEELYSLHFSLYHALYKLKRDPQCASFYLHLDMLRLRLVRVPHEGYCVYYFPDEGKFCARYSKGELFCDFHDLYGKKIKNVITFDPMEDFYLNPENIKFGENEILEKIQKGIILYSLRKGVVDEALEFFGLYNPSRVILQKRYYELAKKYHPDVMHGDETMMKKLNHHYHILREIFMV
ncbi:MAG: hypothetical protein N2316_09640 [Spirochaetes bacterium]|nr:hypothetical protein [Spirochaetota bacterium]